MKITIEFGEHRHVHDLDVEGVEHVYQWAVGDCQDCETVTMMGLVESFVHVAEAFLDERKI